MTEINLHHKVQERLEELSVEGIIAKHKIVDFDQKPNGTIVVGAECQLHSSQSEDYHPILFGLDEKGNIVWETNLPKGHYPLSNLTIADNYIEVSYLEEDLKLNRTNGIIKD